MKSLKCLVGMFALVLFFSVSTFAQQKEMTKEEWQNEMNSLTAQKADLTKERESLKADIEKLKAELNAKKDVDKAYDELYAMVGATKADVDNYRNQVNSLESKIQNRSASKADLTAELNALKASKLSALPEFYTKIYETLPGMLNNWVEEVKESNYTVVKGDCLWFIARRPEHYDNPFAWPKIYKANRDVIKNANLIYPKQSFKIPALTEDEKAVYSKAKSHYKPSKKSHK